MCKKFLSLCLLWLCLVPLWAQEDVTFDETDDNGSDTLLVETFPADSILQAWPRGLQARLQQMVDDPLFERSQLSLMVFDLTDDSLLFAHRPHQLMRPASTMKLLTAVAAIDRLGGSHRFRTSLRYTGTIDSGVLDGRLYVVGGFDPRFNTDDMNAFVESLQKMGVDTIRGAVLMDKTMKDGKQWGAGWCWDDRNPVLSPLTVNGKDRFAEVFMQKVRQAGIVVEATVSEERCPPAAFEICSRFHSLDQVLHRMMKESDNLYAEAMFYQMGSGNGTQTATAKAAAAVVNGLISKVGLPASDYRIADGSGLSLYNYVTAELELAFLRYAFQNANIFHHLYASLPVAGRDGTLKSRMRGSFASGNVRAKTGSVAGVSSLAGYCTASNSHTLCFVFIHNGLRTVAPARRFQDRVCHLLCSPQ